MGLRARCFHSRLELTILNLSCRLLILHGKTSVTNLTGLQMVDSPMEKTLSLQTSPNSTDCISFLTSVDKVFCHCSNDIQRLAAFIIKQPSKKMCSDLSRAWVLVFSTFSKRGKNFSTFRTCRFHVGPGQATTTLLMNS